MDYKVDPKEYGALMFNTENMISKSEIDKAVFAIEDMRHQRPNVANELRTFRKYVPILIRFCYQQQKLIDGYEKLFARIESDSEDKKGQKWCDQEDELLIELACSGMSMLELSTTLGRTPGSIKTRISRLVGTKRISQEIAGRFVGYVNGIHTECSVNGTIYK